jgi:prepilin-type N-terminal cleavage/methylation domain-containing protein
MILSTPTRRRRGFTLIELLVVIAIIGILVSLVLTGAFRTKESTEKSTTSANMQKIASALDQHIKTVADQANTPVLNNSQLGSIYGAIMQYAGNEPRRGRALWLKANLRREFPVSFAELGASLGGLNSPAVFRAVGPPYPTLTPEEQSAVLLYLTLTTSRRGVTHDLEQGMGSSGIKPVREGSPLKVFVDAWGSPIILVRKAPDAWGIQGELDGSKYAGKIDNQRIKSLDSTDREGMLLAAWNPVGVSMAQATTDLSNYIGHAIPEGGTGHNYQFFVASAGPDLAFGTDDDIYSFRMREVGQRGD